MKICFLSTSLRVPIRLLILPSIISRSFKVDVSLDLQSTRSLYDNSGFGLSLNKKVKMLPSPRVDSQLTDPPNSFDISLQMCKPRPMPSVFAFLDTLRKPNSLNSFGLSSSAIPSPLSSTLILRKSSS